MAEAIIQFRFRVVQEMSLGQSLDSLQNRAAKIQRPKASGGEPFAVCSGDKMSIESAGTQRQPHTRLTAIALTKIDALRQSTAPFGNPFLIGDAMALRSHAILRECSVNQLDSAAAVLPWHLTTLQVEQPPGNRSGAILMNATLCDPLGALRIGTVTFTVAPSGERCTAITDEKGQGSYVVDVGGSATSVMATFAEAALEDWSVQLGSSGTLNLQ